LISDALLAVEQHEAIGDALDGIDQVLVGGFRAQTRIAEQLVAGLQLGHRLVQRIGAFAHLLGEHYRVLESRIGIVAARMDRFDPLDQRGIDAFELVVILFQRRAAGLQLGDISLGRDGQWRLR
jgi:hypothetical protein